jgi:hypothetical protein
MTEYDYSPEAYERYLATQNRIARWVDGTLTAIPRNPFTPATPAGQPLVFQREPDDHDDDERRSRRHRSPPRHHREHRENPERRRSDRDRERASELDREYRHPSSRTRHRSPPHSGNPRATHTRSQTLPPPVVVYPSGNRVRSPPRHSRHSSRSSSTTRPRSSSTSANFPQNQLPWNKYSPTPAGPPKPHRSYTNPAQPQHYPYAMDKHQHHAYPDQPVVIPLHPNGRGNTFNRPIDISVCPFPFLTTPCS